MISTRSYNNIFSPDPISQDIAAAYARTGQSDIGLEWLGRHSARIGNLMAYLRVCQGAENACLFINQEIGFYVQGISIDQHFEDMDEDVITNASIVALHYIMGSDSASEDNLCSAIYEEIQRGTFSADAAYLKPLVQL